MAFGNAHLVYVGCAETFLACCRAGEGVFAQAQKILLELDHSRRCKQERRVTRRDQGIGWADHMSVAREKVEVLLPDYLRRGKSFHSELIVPKKEKGGKYREVFTAFFLSLKIIV
jgi:hypothetical protein